LLTHNQACCALKKINSLCALGDESSLTTYNQFYTMTKCPVTFCVIVIYMCINIIYRSSYITFSEEVC